jgi:hypothetical protein
MNTGTDDHPLRIGRDGSDVDYADHKNEVLLRCTEGELRTILPSPPEPPWITNTLCPTAKISDNHHECSESDYSEYMHL